MNAVPFQLADVYNGLAACHGLIRDEGSHLCLEYRVEDAVVGLVKGEVREARIPIDDLASVNVERSWFGLFTRLVIQVARMETVKDVPGMTQGRLKLVIARKDRDAAERLAAGLREPA